MSGQAAVFGGGFMDAPIEAAQAFRAAMSVMARPGDISKVQGARPPKPLSGAAGVLLLTLCDPDTGVFLAGGCDTPEVRGWLAFHTGAPVVAAGQADFALGRWEALMPLAQFDIGTPEYPDRSTTLIVELDALAQAGAVLSGPGIKETAQLSVPDPKGLQANAALYPLGLDFFFTCDDQIAALPRSTRVREG